jgi:cytochrome c oxidase subunit 3
MSQHTINGHDAHVAHHFDGPQHQFDSGKLGMWAFLAQEVLFFSALFVAYIVFRYNHPEVFAYAHKYLDVKYGAINTAVLIFSSLSAAWAVRAAQKNQQKLLIACLATTILCAFGFLGIKYIEYKHKFHIGTTFGCTFSPSETPDGTKIIWTKAPTSKKGVEPSSASNCSAMNGATAKIVVEPPTATDGTPLEPGSPEALKAIAEADKNAPSRYSQLPPPGTNMFFSIYFAMTGLHGIHVLVGIGVFFWLLVRAVKGHFSEAYFGPIDFAALYWHIVDLIWIYLFPLLYLIH